jgi:hypothetical protein
VFSKNDFDSHNRTKWPLNEISAPFGEFLRSKRFMRLMSRFVKFAVIFAAVSLSAVSCGPPRRDSFIVGSKNFTEQAILGELIAQHLEAKTHLHIVRIFISAEATSASKRFSQPA